MGIWHAKGEHHIWLSAAKDVPETVHYQVVTEWRSPIGKTNFFESYGINRTPGQIGGCKIPVKVNQTDRANHYYLGEGEIERESRPWTL